MKVTNGLSAYAVYNSDTKKERDKIVPKTKPKLCRSRSEVVIGPQSGKGLEKVLLALRENNPDILRECNSKEINELKNKSKVKPKSHENKVSKKRKKISTYVKTHLPKMYKKHSEPQIEKRSTYNPIIQRKKKASSNSLQDPIKQGLKLFEWMISPTPPKLFFDNYWEKKHLHIARTNAKYYTHLFTSKCLDSMFRNNDLYYTRNVDVVIYENETKEILNPEGKANPSALWDFYSNGCSIRVLNPQTYNKKVHLLVSTLQEYFGSMVGVNAYLTPPNSQGFAPHFDDIEAFIIQLEGRKHWRLYHPKEEDTLPRHSSKNFTHEEIGNPFLEVTLEEGHLLYFPRGIIHEGRTDSDSHSLHLTVSLYQNNAYVDLLENLLPNALVEAAKSDIEFRKGLPLHFLRNKNPLDIDNDPKSHILQIVSSLMDKLKSHLDIDGGIAELGRKLVYNSMPPVLSKEEQACSSKHDGDMLDNGIVYNKVEFDESTKIRLTRFHCIQPLCKSNTKTFTLYYSTENANVYHGEEEQFLELEEYMLPAIEKLRKAYPKFVEIGSLPLKTIEDRVQFIYDLWEKGIIITKEPLGSSENELLDDDTNDSDNE
ncbi:hypothetical protein WA026_006290 [Henosepilachna vigintioctopunctata]|uniref:Bifunctional lysine-specific demethylase and histidyl-hydroxylase n=1 Tax=Henosepilachna vigintioctopunctata TaxID=420089 RepID=A0AAW1TI55_9CUCU